MDQEEMELALRARWMDLTFCIIDITIFVGFSQLLAGHIYLLHKGS